MQEMRQVYITASEEQKNSSAKWRSTVFGNISEFQAADNALLCLNRSNIVSCMGTQFGWVLLFLGRLLGYFMTGNIQLASRYFFNKTVYF